MQIVDNTELVNFLVKELKPLTKLGGLGLQNSYGQYLAFYNESFQSHKNRMNREHAKIHLTDKMLRRLDSKNLFQHFQKHIIKLSVFNALTILLNDQNSNVKKTGKQLTYEQIKGLSEDLIGNKSKANQIANLFADFDIDWRNIDKRKHYIEIGFYGTFLTNLKFYISKKKVTMYAQGSTESYPLESLDCNDQAEKIKKYFNDSLKVKWGTKVNRS